MSQQIFFLLLVKSVSFFIMTRFSMQVENFPGSVIMHIDGIILHNKK